MADCIRTELSEPFRRIIEIVRHHYGQEKRDVDETREGVNEFLRCLRVALTRLAPRRSSDDAVYLTQDLADMSDTDLVYMMNASPDLLDVGISGAYHEYDDTPTEQDQVTVGEGAAVGPNGLDDTITLPPHQTAANDGMPRPCTATSHVILRGSTDGIPSSMPAGPQSFAPTHTRCTTTPPDKQRKQRNRRHHQQQSNVLPKQRRSRITLQKASSGSTLYPIDKSIPRVRDLLRLLSLRHAESALMLVYVFAEIVALTTFPQFENALRFFSSHRNIQLPRQSQGLLPLMDVLERIEGGQSILCLCRSVGLLRVRNHYSNSEHKIATSNTDLALEEEDGTTRGTLATRTYDFLVREARASKTLGEAEEKTRKRIRNHVAAGRVWSALCNAVGLGILALMPGIAPSTLERVPSSAIDVFVRFVQKNTGLEVSNLIGILSHHLPAILEGDECHLASAVTGGRAENWRHLLVIARELAPCVHPATH